ncbi:MAG: hypothetical protein EXR39_12670 [Betaproteobacteria bacterium]|nr:hypothetical protein [Betaproteobacteria bacterium]
MDDAAIVQRTDKGFRATAGLERGLDSDAVSFLNKIATPVSIGDFCIQTGRSRATLVTSVLDLVSEGYLEVAEGRGTRTQDLPVKAPVAQPPRRPERDAREHAEAFNVRCSDRTALIARPVG